MNRRGTIGFDTLPYGTMILLIWHLCDQSHFTDICNFSHNCHVCTSMYIYIHIYIYTLWLFNIAMEAMAHRNRWFTWVYLSKMVDLSMAMLNNQMVVLGLHSLGRVLQRLWHRPAGHRSFCCRENRWFTLGT